MAVQWTFGLLVPLLNQGLILIQMIDPALASEIPKTLDRPAITYLISQMFRFHPNLSPNIKTLLIKMLDPDTTRRSNIFQVLESEWVVEKGREYNINIKEYRFEATEREKQRRAQERAQRQKMKELSKKEYANMSFDTRGIASKQDNDFTLGDARFPYAKKITDDEIPHHIFVQNDETHPNEFLQYNLKSDMREINNTNTWTSATPAYNGNNSNQQTALGPRPQGSSTKMITLLDKANHDDDLYKQKFLHPGTYPKSNIEKVKKFDQESPSSKNESKTPEKKSFMKELSQFFGCGLD